VDRTIPVPAEDQARALGLEVPDPEATLVPNPVSSATTVRRIPAGYQALGPQGTRAMLRTDLDQPAAPVLIAPPPPPPSPPYGNPRTGQPTPVPRPRKRANRIVLFSVLGALLLAGGGTATWWFTSGRWTSVPAVTDQDQNGAERALRDAGLNPDVQMKRDDTVAAGKVIRTDPAGGVRALRGDRIKLVVSSGRPKVPDVRRGATVDEAKSQITNAELTPGTDDGRNEFDDSVPKGAVLTLDPKPGTQLNLGARVTIVLSKGAKPKPVPNVAGKTRDEAFKILSDAGFQPFDGEREFSPDVDGGRVIKTDPPANKELDDDDNLRVSVIVSNAVTVPDVGQKTVGEAKATLEGLGLEVDVQQIGPNNDNSHVFAQSPSAGNRVEPGTKVILVAFP
jgi:serine/threonine-protein kinase